MKSFVALELDHLLIYESPNSENVLSKTNSAFIVEISAILHKTFFFYLKHGLSHLKKKDTVNGDGIVNLSIKHGQYVKHRKIEGLDITAKV